jgi:alkylation response protein AidB-like acyl-CoA dehydrogenase
MNAFPGFEMPPELALLRDQVRRIIHDEVIPAEKRVDPDAEDLAEEDYHRIAAKTKAAHLWALAAPEKS